MKRKIIHIDMDAFYASVEQRDDAKLRGKAVAVGGSPGGRGVVAAASYEARAFGVRSAMSARVALQRCPQLIFIRPRMQVYRRVSRVVMAILREYSKKVEPLSLDEAYIDVSVSCSRQNRFASSIAQEIRRRIFELLELPASAGVAENKFLAKLASQMAKPNGLFVIRPEEVDTVLLRLTTRAIPGVGRKTEEKLLKLGIHTLKELRERELSFLVEHFGKQGERFYTLSRGIDDREVQPSRERKSLGAERTFPEDIVSRQEIEERLHQIASEVSERLKRSGMSALTITLKVTYFDFHKITRSKTLQQPVSATGDLWEIALELAESTELTRKPARLLGISTSQLTPGLPESLAEELYQQLPLFSPRSES